MQFADTTSPRAPRRRIMHWLSQITEPLQPSVETDQKRRGRLLLRANLALLIATLAYTILAPLSGALPQQTILGILVFMSLSPPAFILGKRGKPEHHQLAVILTLMAIMGGGYIATLFAEGNHLTIAHFGISFAGVLLAGIFLDFKGVAKVAGLNLVIYLILLNLRIPINNVLVGPNHTVESISQYSYIIATVQLVGLSGVFLAFIRFRDQLDEERNKARQIASEQQQLAEELRELERAKSSFLASMSHELRTPLNASINFTRFVLEGDVGPVNEQQIEMLTEVIDSSKHLLSLINDVLDMSKIEAGSLRLFVEEEVKLGVALQKVATTGKGLLVGKSVALYVDVPEDLPTIRGDRQRLTQIFLNVMSNACKFTSEGSIRLCAKAQGDEVLVSVQDTGPGIAAEDVPLVFEAFKQTEAGLRQGAARDWGCRFRAVWSKRMAGECGWRANPVRGRRSSSACRSNRRSWQTA